MNEYEPATPEQAEEILQELAPVLMYKTTKAPTVTLNEQTVTIAMKLIKNFEGCSLVAYPDPESDLYKAMTTHNMVQKWMRGDLKWNDLPEHFQALSGAPWTAMYGETEGIKCTDVFTQVQADERLEKRVIDFMTKVLKINPQLESAAPVKLAAVTSLCYNVGVHNYETSSVSKDIIEGEFESAGKAFLLWDKANGKIVQGLVNRRKAESSLFLSAS